MKIKMKQRTKTKITFWAMEALIFLFGIGVTMMGINGMRMLDSDIVRRVASGYGYTGELGTWIFYGLCLVAGIGAIVGSVLSVFITNFAMKVHTFEDDDETD